MEQGEQREEDREEWVGACHVGVEGCVYVMWAQVIGCRRTCGWVVGGCACVGLWVGP